MDQLLDDAFQMYCKDNKIQPSKDITPLFALLFSETTGYLARAAVNIVLKGGALAPHEQDNLEMQDETCRVS